MSGLPIEAYLEAIGADWEASRNDFPLNTHPPEQWPIPFFGTPQTALVATVGVNPSSNEFPTARKWNCVENLPRHSGGVVAEFLTPATGCHRAALGCHAELGCKIARGSITRKNANN